MRTRSIGSAVATLALAGAVVAGTAGTAAATVGEPAPETGAAPAASSLMLTSTGADSGRSPQSALLMCEPAGGNHPKAADACAALTAADGHFGRIAPNEGACTMEFDPVTLRAQGTWQGRELAWSDTFPNKCTAVRQTAGVFDF